MSNVSDTQMDVLFALAEAIKEASAPDVQAHDTCNRLAQAILDVLAKNAID